MHHQPLRVLRRSSRLLILGGLLFAAAAFISSFLFPLEYRADAQIYIIAGARYGVDPFTTVKSAERIGENITQITQTSDFYDKVISQSGESLDLSRFEGVSERVKRKRWQKAVNTSVVFGTGVLNVEAYHKDPDQAVAFASAVSQTLIDRGREYVGQDVSMRIINSPVATRFPARPNIVVNTVLGFIFGVLLLATIVLSKKRSIIS